MFAQAVEQYKSEAMPKLTVPQRIKGEKQHSWSPYDDNGGTAAAISGKGFVILAGDTRLNGDFCFNTRDDQTKLFEVTPNTFLASTGMQADRLQLQQVLKYKIEWYQYNNGGKRPSTPAIAQLLSTVLYNRRFFPYYTFNIIAGMDEEGNGVCYSYDAVGCTEPLNYGTTGSGNTFIEPLMDCLIGRSNMVGKAPKDMELTEALEMLKNAFTGAAERDIYTGDGVNFIILTKDGARKEYVELRHD